MGTLPRLVRTMGFLVLACCSGVDVARSRDVAPVRPAPLVATSSSEVRALAWVRDPEGQPTTYHLDASGKVVARTRGVLLASTRGPYTWQTQKIPVLTAACPVLDEEGRETGREERQEGHATSASLVRSGGGETQTILDGDDEGPDQDPGSPLREFTHDVTLVAQVGPYLFLHMDRSMFPCAAPHGGTSSESLVWNIETGKRADLTGSLGGIAEAHARAVSTLAAKDELGLLGPRSVKLTELLPSFEAGQLRMGAQLTGPACFVCSDGRWSSYTRSTVEPIAMPGELLAQASEPVALFSRAHPELPLRGFGSL